MKLTATKREKLIFWISTGLFLLFESGGALFFNTSFAIAGIKNLGFPYYFGVELGIAKIIGGIVILFPMIPNRVKEWAYVGFGISLVSAVIANAMVIGFLPALFPAVFSLIFITSYVYFHKVYSV